MLRFLSAFCFSVALVAAAVPAAAQCGSPPDPRTNTAGYASWCSCMGGTYNYQTTACVGATGPRTRGGDGASSALWYCRARARNGAWGWAEYASESEARQRALAECSQRSRGQSCAVQYCRLGGRAAAEQQQRSTANGRLRAAYDCDVCHRKLKSDIRSGWASGRLVTYVDQAIAGYENCKRKASGSCQAGDILVRSIRNGCRGFRGNNDNYRACIGRVLP